MADKVTQGTILAVGVEYERTNFPSKTAYIKIPNPKAELSEETIKTAFTPLITNILIDEELQPITATQIVTAYTEYTKKTELDLGFE